MIVASCALYESLGSARCRCCSIICTPAGDGRCSTCSARNATVCPGCNVHVYEGEQCEECAALTDSQLEALLETAIADEDIELVVLCETALAQIVQPNLKREAVARIAEILSAREAA